MTLEVSVKYLHVIWVVIHMIEVAGLGWVFFEPHWNNFEARSCLLVVCCLWPGVLGERE